MATVSKDFKVKNGLIVGENGTFAGTVSVATPTSNNHATTKSYVDGLVESLGNSPGAIVSDTEPLDPSSGTIWFDTASNHPKIYVADTWQSMAMYIDTISVANHTHNSTTGLLEDVFIDGGIPSQQYILTLDGGTWQTTDWSETFSGGTI